MRSFFFICATSSSQIKIIFTFFRKYGFAIDLTTLLMMGRDRIPSTKRRIESGQVRHSFSGRNVLFFSPWVNKQFTSTHSSEDKNIIYVPCHGSEYLTVQVISLGFFKYSGICFAVMLAFLWRRERESDSECMNNSSLFFFSFKVYLQFSWLPSPCVEQIDYQLLCLHCISSVLRRQL